ncbi:PREDICTED: sodium-coupled monocarboxylate transporter 2-like [Branchiostoma belcheri]|uniref:Sodium-coupled monocarboxylate transporter 2-like n=1 Tax=Branchiostoma belcheri TaxID=7741 RepID=A0A6P4Z7Q4_BRABE|nr:PREDICTED: sodium-coupled monocarboxylate transporter 2-like [Branchiostoma belcheri]
MSVVPVALSLLASFISAITVLGTPAEIYTNGTMFWNFVIAYTITILLVARLFIPAFYSLGLTSTYEYLEIRFSKVVRLVCTVLFMANMLLYMGLVLYVPSLALNAVTGLTLWGAVVAVGVVCTFYTTLGGMKAVMWTDAFQVVVMVAGFLSVIIQGTMDVGGMARVWQLNTQGQRIQFFNFDPDPRIRHSSWSVAVGGTFIWLAVYGVNQAQVQRYLSCPSVKKAQIAILWNIPGLSLLVSFACVSGLVMYARYHDCDPRLAGYIDNSDQMMPYFVMDILGKFPGMPGLFTACVFSGALSTMSSGLNALAAVALEDFVKPCFPNFSDLKYTWISKGLAMLFGCSMILMAYVASLMGPVVQASLSIFGMVGGPMLGVFVLGMFFPCANKWGGLAGLLTSLAMSLWVGLGGFVWPRSRWMPPVSTEGCPSVNVTANITTQSTVAMVTALYDVNNTAEPTSIDYPPESVLYELSYAYLGAFATVICIVIGLLVSCITGPQKPEELDPKLTIPVCDSLFCCLPNSWLKCLRCGVKQDQTEDDKAMKMMDIENPSFTSETEETKNSEESEKPGQQRVDKVTNETDTFL